MTRKLTLTQLAKEIGTDKAIAAYITAHGEFPKGRFSLAEKAAAVKELPWDSEIRKQIVAHIVRQTKGSFKQWCAVVKVTRFWEGHCSEDGKRILQHALQQCLKKASAFNHWYTLHEDLYFRDDLRKLNLKDHVLAQTVESAQTFDQLKKTLASVAGKNKLRRKIITKLKECASWSQWLQVLKGDYDRHGNSREHHPIAEAAVQQLLPEASGFSDFAKIMRALPYHGMNSAKRKLVMELAEHAQTRKQWEKVEGYATGESIGNVRLRASEALLLYLRTLNDWRRFRPANQKQKNLRIQNMRRLAKFFKQWKEIYRYETHAQEDLEKMKSVGTLADWNAVYISDYFDEEGELLKGRNEAFAAHLK